jgi:histidine triad (HIT) family protein
MNTIFQDIIKRKIPAFIIYEDEHAIAFFDRKPVCEGHTLVIPKKDFVDIFDISEQDLVYVISAAKKVATILQEKLGCEGVNILHASGKAAQQSVFHFHLHVIPRHHSDGLDMWPKVEYRKIDLLKVHRKIVD